MFLSNNYEKAIEFLENSEPIEAKKYFLKSYVIILISRFYKSNVDKIKNILSY